MKLDILAIAAHPDDVELSCSGTLLVHSSQGKKVGILDLTQGELGTRGTPSIREKEAHHAASLLDVAFRYNLKLRDGFFKNDEQHQLEVIKLIRKYQPEIVLANAITDRHPDHGRAAQLISDSCFLAGLIKIETTDEGVMQKPWRPKKVYHYIQDRWIKPQLVVDITPFWNKKIESIRAFQSQFYNPQTQEPQTYISTPEFLEFIEARAKEMGHLIGVKYGEGFTTQSYIGVGNLFHLI